jgi:hypothetical protein
MEGHKEREGSEMRRILSGLVASMSLVSVLGGVAVAAMGVGGVASGVALGREQDEVRRWGAAGKTGYLAGVCKELGEAAGEGGGVVDTAVP